MRNIAFSLLLGVILYITPNNLFGQFTQVSTTTLPAVTVNDCIGKFADGGLTKNTTYYLKIEPTLADSIEVEFTLLSINGSGSLIISDGVQTDQFNSASPIPEIKTYKSPINLTYDNNENPSAIDENEFKANWRGIISTDGAITNVTCNGSSNGIAQVYPTGGTNPYSYNWMPNGETTRKITGLSPDTYSVRITDANSCIKDTSFTITQPAELNATINQTKISCYGANNGEATVNASGGSGSYTYAWSHSKGSAVTAINLNPTETYTCTITDANNTDCFITRNISVSQNPQITATINETKVSCYNANDGIFEIDASGGNGTLSYNWNLSKGTDTLAIDLTPGETYSCTVTDQSNCTVNQSKQATAQNPEITTTISQAKIACYGINDGQARVTATGGSNSFSFQWSDTKGSNDTAFALSPSVTYFCTITDQGPAACEFVESISISQNPEITAFIDETKIPCYNVSDGTAIVNAGGGTGTLKYLWSNATATTTANVADLAPSSGYNCIITDDNDCSVNPSFTTSAQNPQITATINETKPACFGLTNGEAEISVSGGSNSYTYLWSNSKGTNTVATGLDPSITYSVTVYDANVSGCEITTSKQITENDEITTTIDTADNNGWAIACNGNSNGYIEVIPAGGTPNYTYLWDDTAGQTNRKATGLTSGSYTLTITDSYNCIKTETVTIHEPYLLTINEELVTNVTVNGGETGAIDISVSNASGGISAINWTGPNTIDGVQDQTGLPAGSFFVSITDGNSCSASKDFTITEPSVLNAGTIEVNNAESTTVCNNTLPPALENSVAASGGSGIGTYIYTWQYKTSSGIWTDIATSNLETLTWPSVLTEDLYFRRKVEDDATFAFSNTLYLDFIPPYSVSIQNLDTAYCNNASDEVISGFPASANSYFKSDLPSINLVGSETTLSPVNNSSSASTYYLKYVYVDTHGCKDSTEKSFYIRPVPTVTLALDQTVFSSTDDPYVLNGESPSGGTFYGPAVSPSNNTFYPSSLSEGETATITYVWPNTYGCSDTATQDVSIVSGYGNIRLLGSNTMQSKYCKTGYVDSVWIEAIPGQNMTSGTFLGYNKNTLDTIQYSIDNQKNDSTGIIVAEYLEAGTYVIEFKYNGSDGEGKIETEIVIYNVQGDAQFIEFDTAYCNYQQTVTIKAKDLENGDQGIFTPLSGITDNNNGSAILDIDVASSNPNPINIQYIYTHNESQCKDTLIQPITINPLPEANFEIKTLFNRLGPEIKMNNISPHGGLFKGKGVSEEDSTFNPIAANIGYNIISYSVEDVNHCKDTARITVSVENAKGSFEGINTNNIYCIDGIDDVINYKPADADDFYPVSFEIEDSLITKNDTATFSPSTWKAGEFTFKFSYLGRDSLTLFWITEDVFVDDIGSISIHAPKTDYCNYEADAELTGFLGINEANLGKFSGDGVSQDNTDDGLHYFNPRTGSAYIGENKVYYTYNSTTPGSSCYKVDSVTLTVHNRPTVDFTLNELYNVNGANDTIKTDPFGGYFTPSEYFIYDSIFIPSSASIGDLDLTYNYTDEFECFNSISKTAVIEGAKGTIHGLATNNIYCADGINDTVNYLPADAKNYTPLLFTLGNDTLSVSSDTAVILPSLITPGTYDLTFAYLAQDNYTRFEISEQIIIDKIGNLSINTPSNSFCEYEESQIIEGFIDGTKANLGLFSGTGIDPIDIGNDGEAFFNPKQADIGTNTITYIYNSTRMGSSCYKSTTKNIVVNPVTPLNFKLPLVYNIDGPNDTLLATPRGGTYEPKEFIYQDTILDISKVELDELELSYIYENTYGCVDTIKASTLIDEAEGLFLGVDSVYCYHGADDIISVIGIPNPSNAVGTFSGWGITNTGKNEASFNPTIAYDKASQSASSNEVTVDVLFTYKGIDDSTEFQLIQKIKIRKNEEIAINGLDSDLEYCENETAVTLSATPEGGIFSGNGINGNSFIPSNVNAFNDTSITYTYTYTYESYGISCTSSKTIDLTIHNIPDADINIPPNLCSNSDVIKITGIPTNGTFIQGINGSVDNDTINYKPSADDVGNHSLVYVYEEQVNFCKDTAKQTLTVNPIPFISISEETIPEKGFCIDGDAVEIQGLYNNNPANKGTFEGIGIVNSHDNGKATFDPKEAEISNVNKIYFTYQDDNLCTNTDSLTIKVNSLPVVSVNVPDAGYCEDKTEEVSIQGNQNQTGSLFIVNNTPSNNTSIFKFRPNEYSNSDSLFVIYNYTDENSCSNSDSLTVYIWKLPDADFNDPDVCIAEATQLNYSGNTDLDKIKSFKWNFGDNKPVTNGSDSLPYTSHKYTIEDTEGLTTIRLEVTDTNGCFNYESKNILFEINPSSEFSWIEECVQNTINFNPINLNDTLNYSVKWDFGDEEDLTNGSDTLFKTSHVYQDTGAYQITYTISSIKSTCSGISNKIINIRPVVKLASLNDNYIESFENGHGSWIPESLDTATIFSWEYGKPKGTIIKQSFDGENIYATNLTGSYIENENSVITSPCFDFTGVKKPMISLSIFKQMENQFDGIAIEYTTDKGLNWLNLGELDEGINWYNDYRIASKPGNNQVQGWTDSDAGWLVAKHDLNNLKNKNNVRFRIAFASIYENPVLEGFAFDNIVIGNRTRRVLVEHFTNTESTSSNNSNNIINNSLIDRLPLDAIDIQYHTSTFTNDPFYKNYPSGSSARESYYNITSIPYTYLDGSIPFDYSNSTPQEKHLISQALVDPLFNIDLDINKSGNTIEIDADIEALENINDRQLKIFNAIVEKSVTLTTANNLVLQNVLRNFVPDAAGEYLNSNWEIGDNRTYNYSYTKDNYVENLDSVNVITFIQDELTKEILQAATTDTTSIGTNVEEFLSSKLNNDFLIFPNPANKSTQFIFSNNKEKMNFEIFNQQGKIVHSIQINENQINYSFDCKDLYEGVYFVRIRNIKFQKTKKLVIVH